MIDYRLISAFLFVLSGHVNAQTNNRLEKELDDMMAGSESGFDGFVDRIHSEYNAFRDSINNDYAKFLEGTWKSTPLEGVVKYEKDKEIKPIIQDERQNVPPKSKTIKGTVVPIVRDDKPQPKPVSPIRENKLSDNYSAFSFYGTMMRVRWGNASNFKFAKMSNKDLANAYRTFSGRGYQNLLYDCLKLRDEYALCDWAYYKMLEKLSETACGKGTNEATFLKGVLYGQSGYMMRFAIDRKTNRLYLLCRMTGGAYDYPYYMVDGKVFYVFEKLEKGSTSLEYCPKEYAGEQEMSLEINQIPNLVKTLTAEKKVHSSNNVIQVQFKTNKNLIDFYNDYPTSFKDNNFMTRWAYYANTPASEEMQNFVYPQLREKIKGIPPVSAVNMILSWVRPLSEIESRDIPKDAQVGFPYGYDNEIWGCDRAFFADETLYYPFSDCEDHAILFSRIVRDLLGLDVVLVYYPNHLATAVKFDTEVKGDAILVDRQKFMVCDPTSYRGKVGVTMSQFEDTDPKQIKIILLKK